MPDTSPKFQDIANQLEQLMDDGVYPVNSKLPTQRELADQFATTPVTISKAIKSLIRRHRVQTVTGSGTYVLAKGELAQAIRADSASDDFNFSILQPCLGYNQTVLEDHVRQLSRQRLMSALFEYKENSGHPHHKAAGMQWCARWGLQETTAEDFFLVNGAQQALSSIVELCSKPGDAILVEELTYPGLLAVINLLGRKPVPVKLDDEGMVIDSLLEQQAKHQAHLLFVTPSMHNPTTITMSAERRATLARVIQSLNLLAVEDDLYAFLADASLPRLADLAPAHVFYVSSLSKAISPGLRAGYIRAPKAWNHRLAQFLRAMSWLSPPLVFELAAQLIESGDAFRLAEQQRRIASERQVLCRSYFKDMHYKTDPVSYHVWLTLPAHWTTERFMHSATQHNIQLTSAGFFTADQHSSNHVRVSLMAIDSESSFKQGLAQLRDLLHSTPSLF